MLAGLIGLAMPQQVTPAKRRPNPAQPKSTKKEAKKAPNAQGTTTRASSHNPKHQQELLDIFSNAFSSVLTAGNFDNLVQEIKQSLYHRDFATAFGKEDYLRAYAARWSPTRALAYSAVLEGLSPHLKAICNRKASCHESLSARKVGGGGLEGKTTGSQSTGNDDENLQSPASVSDGARKSLTVLSIGGCAAEHLAVASYLHLADLDGSLYLLDSGPWASIVDVLQSHVTSSPPLSKYASAAAKSANKPLLEPSALQTSFMKKDVLALDEDGLKQLTGDVPVLVTLFFTLNELYTSGGIGPTTKLLKNLGTTMSDQSLLLVVDSPGSYSEAAVGKSEGEKEKKKYPMQWLLHHTLTGTEAPGYEWERLESQDSVWFRLPEGLHYPIQLENMRYQMHLYRIQQKMNQNSGVHSEML